MTLSFPSAPDQSLAELQYTHSRGRPVGRFSIRGASYRPLDSAWTCRYVRRLQDFDAPNSYGIFAGLRDVRPRHLGNRKPSTAAQPRVRQASMPSRHSKSRSAVYGWRLRERDGRRSDRAGRGSDRAPVARLRRASSSSGNMTRATAEVEGA